MFGYNMAYKYSEGTRTGTVFKVSKKGALCKTWEGTMSMDGYGAVGGQGVTAAFDFTVMDDAVLEKIKDAETSKKHVQLEYRQVKWRVSCLQDSEYVVTGVNEITPEGRTSPYVLQPAGRVRR